ncbi:N-carbamoylputrescine amidase [Fluviispira multicolorata]|uniref:N-carbamoylputrescine amidase n=1 Tax=Fluviispira multicolorata TaxID=2654512 RepID=A0A833N0A5_9BACT|nr:N-carbamoylputrescine amidase [Fluviispira multicolorata]KAB8028133.1 N-carbamoylputrescine amidase [Fluviispira multicolorata]
MQENIKLALIQMSMTNISEENIKKSINFIEKAADKKANIILLPELFENLYFCQEQHDHLFSLANEAENHPFLEKFQQIARNKNVVLPISFFEKSGQAYYNSLAMIDADGSLLGIYRKTHIPDGPCYQEKYYFNPGDTGFKVWKTAFGNIGVGICWDQWFPECARSMVLQGADLLLYPTAIGSEPPEAHSIDTKDMWQRAMIGHAVCNSVYLAAPNRVGTENNMTFYGSSFISNYMGDKIAESDRTSEEIIYADLSFKDATTFRAGMGFFRDRRPEHYKMILGLDGK